MTEAKELPDLIKSIMKDKGLDSKQVAEKRGVSQGTFSGSINKQSMNLNTLHSIFKAMGEDVVFVLSNGKKYKLKIK